MIRPRRHSRTPPALRFALLVTIAGCAGSASSAGDPPGTRGPASGADIVVGSLVSIEKWGEVGGIVAYSLGSTACNAGDAPVSYSADTSDHPVFAQNLYRLRDGRFEQIGMSWVAHGYSALAQNACGFGCQDPGTGSLLGVGCSTTSSAAIHGNQGGFGGVGGLGPRSEVEVSTGFFSFPYGSQGMSGDAIYKRLQVNVDDVDPELHDGALFFAEGHFVAPDDALAGNGLNNVSHRRVEPSADLDLLFVDATEAEQPAIFAWQVHDPAVRIDVVDVPGDGRLIVGARATKRGPQRWSYEYAVYNLSSHRSAGRFAVPLLPGTDVVSTGFHDVDSHSGEPFGGTDWQATVDSPGGSVAWSTADFAEDPDANALRWGTLYNFRFEAFAAPGLGIVEVGLFRPGSPSSIEITTLGATVDESLLFGDGFETGDASGWN